MSKPTKRPDPTPADVAKELLCVAALMHRCANNMRNLGGIDWLDGPLAKHADEMDGAAGIAEEWVGEMTMPKPGAHKDGWTITEGKSMAKGRPH